MSESLNHKNYSQYIRFKALVLVVLLTLLIFLALADLALGSAGLSLADVGKAVFGLGDRKVVTIVQKMRLPRVATALVAGAGLEIGAGGLCVEPPATTGHRHPWRRRPEGGLYRRRAGRGKSSHATPAF